MAGGDGRRGALPRLAAAVMLSALVAGVPARAEVPPSDVALAWLGQRLYGDVITQAQFVANALQALQRADVDADGLTAADLSRLERKGRAENRADRLHRTLRYDLDGDLRITPAEVREALGGQGSNGALTEIGRLDVDMDGDVTLDEIIAVTGRVSVNNHLLGEGRFLLTLEPASDGRLTAEELSALAREAFGLADADGDRAITQAEARAFRAAHPYRRPEPPPEVYCVLPRARAGEEVVLVGAYQGGGPEVPGARPRVRDVSLRIETGAQPLYIVATSYSPVRWRVVGDARRVSRLVVLAGSGGRPVKALVTGLSPRRVLVRNRHGCIPYFSDPGGADAVRAMTAARQAIGRGPDVLFGSYAPREVLLPSARPALEP